MKRRKLDFENDESRTRNVLSLAKAPDYIRRLHERDNVLWVPTGSALLNLALSGHPYCGFACGKMANIIGDSHAGKTFLFWQMMAEVLGLKRFDPYHLFYNDAESALEIDIENLFGDGIHRVELEDCRTKIIEVFFSYVEKLLKGKKNKEPVPFIGGLDSLDPMKSREELSKSVDELAKRDYPDIPRILSGELGRIADLIKDTASLLIIISQTRKNIGVKYGAKQRRSGGDALRFYCSYEIWLAIKEHIKRRDRDMGVWVRVRVTKNKMTGKQREVEVPIIVDYGIDDLLSMVLWMYEEGFWKKEKARKGEKEDTDEKTVKRIDTCGDFINGSYDEIIHYVEEKGYEDDLRNIVAECWWKIEDEIATRRKSRYKD